MTKENRLSMTTTIGYALGDFGGSIAFQAVTLFIVFYFTDVFGLSAASAGLIFALAKLWNAVCDPAIGALSDKIRTRWGQKRPFLLFGAIPLGISFALLVASPAVESKFVYALVTFLLFSSAYSFVGVPYGAITASITPDPDERSRLTAYRMAFAIFAILLIGGITRPIVASFATPQEGFRVVGILYGALAAFFTLVTFFTTKERDTPLQQSSSGIRESFALVWANTPFVLLSGAIILHLAAITILATLVNYYFKYNLKAEAYTPVAFVCLFISAAIALPIWLKIQKKIGMKNAFNAGMVLLALTLFILLIIPEPPVLVVVLLLVIAGLGMSTIYIFPWAMVPSTVDYTEWKTGKRKEGLLYGYFYFAFKAASALGGLLAGYGLDLAGYMATPENMAGNIQSPDTLLGMRILMTALPIFLILLGIGLVHRYPIDMAMQEEMSGSLKANA